MRNNTQPPAPTRALLRDVLTDPQTTEHFGEMLHVATVEQRESCFAVYETAGTYAVSQLVHAELGGVSLDTVQGDHTQVSPLSLVRKRLTYDTIDDSDRITDETYGIKVHNDEASSAIYAQHIREQEHTLSESAQRAIANIEADIDLPARNKQDLITSVIAKDMRTAQKVQSGGEELFRDDVVLLAHNHPTLHYDVLTGSIITPSMEDLATYEILRKYSPRLIEAIVASNGIKDRALLLYSGGHQDRQISRFASGPEFHTVEQNVRFLQQAGYVATALSLRADGALARGSLGKIARFAADLKQGQ